MLPDPCVAQDPPHEKGRQLHCQAAAMLKPQFRTALGCSTTVWIATGTDATPSAAMRGTIALASIPRRHKSAARW